MTNPNHAAAVLLAQAFAACSGKQLRQRKAWHDPELAQDVADWYMSALAGDRTPTAEARTVWAELMTHIERQHAVLAGTFEITVVDFDPYPGGTDELFADLDQGRINVLSTVETGGHPLWTNEQNDKFRAVHDILGHYAQRVTFARDGEDAAFRSHASMLPDSVLPALAVETRAQSNALCYGPDPGTFKDQLCVVPPAFVWATHNHELEW